MAGCCMMGVTAAQVGLNTVSNEKERWVEGRRGKRFYMESCISSSSSAAEPL